MERGRAPTGGAVADQGMDPMSQVHGQHGHHCHSKLSNEQRVFWCLLLTGGFMVVEVVGGILSGSLALLADAGHMLADSAALGLAWFAFRAARRPADFRRSYGYHRAQVLAAFLNGVTLVAIVIWIFVEAVSRLITPVEVLAVPMLAVAACGLLVNLAAMAILHAGDRNNINLRAAALHVMGDLLGSVATILAAGIIFWTGWMPVDPLLSMAVALLILRSAWAIVAQSAHILLEGTPEGLDVDGLRRGLVESVPEVADIHHVHVWSLTSDRPLLTLHARIEEAADHAAALQRINAFLAERYGIDHTTIQIEKGDCADHA